MALLQLLCLSTGSAFKADVAVADGMQLPYSSNRFDAALSIAVLHHITTPARRIHMLKELLRILRPGGKALVTVWATEQEDTKKLAKWQPINQPGHEQHHNRSHQQVKNLSGSEQESQKELKPCNVQTGAHADSNTTAGRNQDLQNARLEQSTADTTSVPDTTETILQQASNPQGKHVELSDAALQSEDAQHPGKAQQQPSTSSNDYFVPWHLPFHRAEAALQVLKVGGQEGNAPAAAGSIRIDNQKNSVVFSRYYHVYEQFELDQLVLQVPGAEVLDTFYDKDNWCVVMGKTNE